jgi:hypothetical protein
MNWESNDDLTKKNTYHKQKVSDCAKFKRNSTKLSAKDSIYSISNKGSNGERKEPNLGESQKRKVFILSNASCEEQETCNEIKNNVEMKKYDGISKEEMAGFSRKTPFDQETVDFMKMFVIKYEELKEKEKEILSVEIENVELKSEVKSLNLKLNEILNENSVLKEEIKSIQTISLEESVRKKEEILQLIEERNSAKYFCEKNKQDYFLGMDKSRENLERSINRIYELESMLAKLESEKLHLTNKIEETQSMLNHLKEENTILSSVELVYSKLIKEHEILLQKNEEIAQDSSKVNEENSHLRNCCSHLQNSYLNLQKEILEFIGNSKGNSFETLSTSFKQHTITQSDGLNNIV